jgi:hypothetical protein
MNLIPDPLVNHDPNNHAFGRKLAKLIATMRRLPALPPRPTKPHFRNGMQALSEWEGTKL